MFNVKTQNNVSELTLGSSIGQNVLECNVLRASVLNAPIRDAMLAAEATPWLRPLSYDVAGLAISTS